MIWAIETGCDLRSTSRKHLTSISPISSLRNWEVLLQYPFIQLSEEEHRDPSKVAPFGEWGFWRFKLISC